MLVVFRTSSNRARAQLRGFLRRRGYDFVRYPTPPVGFDRRLQGLLRSLEINCVLDVGARFGDFGRRLRLLGYQGRIVSFEPVASSFAVLRDQVDDAWEARQLALGSETERRVIAHSMEPGSDSFLHPSTYGLSNFGDFLRPVGEEQVDVTTLDAVFAETVSGLDEPRVLLKLDTQGWERHVLLGGKESLHQVDALQMEVSTISLYDGEPSYLEMLALVAEHGFVPVWFDPVVVDRQGRPPQFDCLLQRVELSETQ
jgi:FkbM family methyltransferase